MNVAAILEVLFVAALPLLLPRVAAAPVVAASLSPAAFHAALTSPPGQLGLPGLPAAKDRPAPPRRLDPSDLGPVVGAQSATVVDRASGAELFAKDADRVQSIASLTKLMTALVVVDTHPDWDAEVTLAQGDLKGGTTEYVLPGETVTVRDLLDLALVGSSNTAAYALARSTGMPMDAFVAAMDAKAAALGMTSARFADPTGLDEGNRGSARDVALLASAAFAVPEIATAATTETYVVHPEGPKGTASRTVKSTDLLLGSGLARVGYAIAGAKTGTLGAVTGYHVAIALRSPEGNEVLAVVLGSGTYESRFTDAKTLALWAFGAYRWNDTGEGE